MILTLILLVWMCEWFMKSLSFEQKKESYEIHDILWKIRDNLACMKNAVNFLVA